MHKNTLFLRRWNEIIAEAVNCQDRGQLVELIVQAVSLANNIDSICVFIYDEKNKPVALYDFVQPTGSLGSTENYIKGAYLLNPFYQLCVSDQPSGIFFLNNLVSADFWQGEHYKSYYQYANIEDEADFLFPLKSGSTFVVSIARDESQPKFSQADRDTLWSIEPLMQLLVERYEELEEGNNHQHTYNLATFSSLDEAIDSFFGSKLSTRELEVVRLMLRGNTGVQIAKILERSPDTIKAHKKSIYNKLEVSTLGDLFAGFIEFLSRS